MTVCIGALCDGGKAAVIAADEMVTFGAPMNLQVEPPDLRKIVPISASVALLYAGTVPDGEEIIGAVRSRIGTLGGPATVDAVAECVKDAYYHHKRRRAEETILRPWLGLDFQQFQELSARSPGSQILGQVLSVLSQHNLQTDFLVAGSDDTGCHLFTVNHPGVRYAMDTLGYATIGSGAMHAGISLALNKHTASAPLERTLFRVFEAKIAAQVSPGVGYRTDVAILRDGAIQFVKSDTLEVLARVHKEHPDISDGEVELIRTSLQ